jgi:prepilin peptidase CpaA
MDFFLLIKIFFCAYIALLVAAASYDVGKFIIPNWISISLLGLFAAALVVLPVPVEVANQFLGMVAVLGGSLVLYRFRILGGGDLKLATAVGLWIGWAALPEFLIVTAVVGGGFALGLIVLRRVLMGLLLVQTTIQNVALPRLLLPGEQIPYGMAIAAGGIWAARKLPHLGLYF